MKYEWIKGQTVSVFSGGVAVAPVNLRSSISNPDVDARLLDTGLTATGLSSVQTLGRSAWARLTHSATQAGGVSAQLRLDFGDCPLELAYQEVFGLRQLVTSVIGDNVGGFVCVSG
jgi:hypothetical protein